MILTIIALAALVVLTPFLTRLMGRATGWPLAAAYFGVAALFTPTAAEVMTGTTPEVTLPWAPSLGVDMALRADGIGVIFTYIALIIGAIVFVYSTAYLPQGPGTLSFYWLMVVFTFSMVALVLSNDLIVLFICWELTSLASFFLIARSGSPGQAPSLRTLFITFIGGLTLLVAVGVTIAVTGTTNLHEALVSDVWANQPAVTTLVAVLVAIAAMTKSAQFPFHSWLPDAMAAATPVSAYLHAAAVVKAGIFLMMRFSPAFHATPAWNVILISAGLITAFIGGWFALNQHDVKKLMAYSTVSQLGLITAVIGVGTEAAIAAAALHVIAHALFKSGLFMMVASSTTSPAPANSPASPVSSDPPRSPSPSWCSAAPRWRASRRCSASCRRNRCSPRSSRSPPPVDPLRQRRGGLRAHLRLLREDRVGCLHRRQTGDEVRTRSLLAGHARRRGPAHRRFAAAELRPLRLRHPAHRGRRRRHPGHPRRGAREVLARVHP